MQVGDLVKVKNGSFMHGLMGLIVKEAADACGNQRLWVKLIGPVPRAIQGKPVMYRPERLILIKGTEQ